MGGPVKVSTTMCPMNCHPTLCGMKVTTQDGKLVEIKGDENNPDSQGFLCVRGQAAEQIIGNPARLLHPMIREQRGVDAWREASWDEALDMIAERIGRAGREATALWSGHGNIANGYGVSVGGQLVARFANLWGCQNWSGAMICWGMGGFGLGLTGALEVNTKEDMSAHSRMVIMWGANLASQPNTARHLIAAKKRGARIVTIDVRETEAAARSDDVFLIRPGTDAALALAMMHVILAEDLADREFVDRHTVGFAELAAHVRQYTPQWAEAETGIAAARIETLARAYATARPAMIVLGGSSIHKSANAWHAARAISCLPALAGLYGVPGGGLGERHGALAHGGGFSTVAAADQRPPGAYIPAQMPEVAASLSDGRVRALLLFGTNMLSSFADTKQVEQGLAALDLVVCHDLFMNETTRRFADIVLPGTAWLEDVGCKSTHTHLYLADKILEPAGEARAVQDVLRGLANRLGLEDYYPWADQEAVLDEVLQSAAADGMTMAKLRAAGGRAPLAVSKVAYPTHSFHSPSGKIEFYSARAEEAGLPPLPMPGEGRPANADKGYPLILCQGRSLTHFHAFYDHGQALPKLAERDPGAVLWLSPADAERRGLAQDAPLRVFNAQGSFEARAHVTERIPEGVTWMRDGIAGLNRVTSGAPVLPEAALDFFRFTVGQADYRAMVEVAPA